MPIRRSKRPPRMAASSSFLRRLVLSTYATPRRSALSCSVKLRKHARCDE